MVIYLQYFGGRGANSGINNYTGWLSMEGEGTVKTELEPIDVGKYEGQSLEKIEARLRSLPHEELFAVDSSGKVIEAYKGDAVSVGFPASLLKEKDITVTHGHPKGYEEFGGNLSFADINNMLNSDWKEHRATASGQGEMNYIMRRTDQADAAALRIRINKDYLKLQRKTEDAYKTAYLKEKQLHGEKQARHVARQKQVGVLNAYYKEVFPQYGFEYITRKKEYKYNR